jgi:hypothetical protein
MLTAFQARPIVSAKSAQAAVACVKSAIADAAARLRPKSIELYYAGPAALAVALGHRWNAMPRTNIYEFDSSTRVYTTTASLDPAD